jgi:lactate permease
MYKQVLDPVSHSLGLTSILALLPLVVLFVLLGVLRLKAQWAALITLGVAILVALIVYSMPVGQAVDSGLDRGGPGPAPGVVAGSSDEHRRLDWCRTAGDRRRQHL